MSEKILVVDDELPLEKLITQHFRREIRSGTYEFIFAHNGREALEKLQADPEIEVMLTDINMPEMDGLTLLGKLQEINRNIKAVVISAYSDIENIKTAMNRGAFDFLTKPIVLEDLEITLTKTMEQVQHVRENLLKLQQAQVQLVQSEKMSALGQLIAGVAHEINNPIGSVVGNLQHAEEYMQAIVAHLRLYQNYYPDPVRQIIENAEVIDLSFLLDDLPKILRSLNIGAERIQEISTSLRTFARSDTREKVKFNIHDGIDSTLLILKHRLKANEERPAIEVTTAYGPLPLVTCYPGQLNQVFMNVISNAIDALEESNQGRSYAEISANPNTILISTEVRENGAQVAIRIKDNGLGMSEEIKQKAFAHLFTTKPVGQGTGLGLFISRQIVEEKHQGTLLCISARGEGSEFIIRIPV